MTKILIVDDDPRYQQLLKVNLEQEGYEIICSGDGQDSILKVVNQHPDLVILDIMMPQFDGLKTCERIRQLSNIPIIFLTACGEEADRVIGLNTGADDYVVKPFSAIELVARVKAVLRRSQTSEHILPNRYFIHGNLKIDIAHAEAWMNNKPVNLSSTEYKLLIHFATHIGKVLTAEEILIAVWGPQYVNDKEILWVSIARLRQKIDDKSTDSKYIVTRSGVGYYMPPVQQTYSA